MYVTVTDLKNYVYCPYLVYIKRVLGIEERTTEYMIYGKTIEIDRLLTFLYAKLNAVKILRNLELRSRRIKLSGRVDVVIVDKYGQYIPVDIKWSNVPEDKARRDHIIQICAYALLIEENFRTIVKRGYIYYVSSNEEGRLQEIMITSRLKQQVLKIVQEIQEMLIQQRPPSRVVRRISNCVSCPCRSYCIFRQS